GHYKKRTPKNKIKTNKWSPTKSKKRKKKKTKSKKTNPTKKKTKKKKIITTRKKNTEGATAARNTRAGPSEPKGSAGGPT
ncbi:hypothetical protein ACS229_30780, partial [Klebsiella pneumoniae]|uniref:hypothetical protein n=1 Tax=Klebsiella pneumoniae TaxID=573 RepID=UPI003F28289D